MKIDARDLAKFEKKRNAVRDAFIDKVDKLSDSAVEKLTCGGRQGAIDIVRATKALGSDPVVAQVLVWTDVYDACKSVLNSAPEYTMQSVIDAMLNRLSEYHELDDDESNNTVIAGADAIYALKVLNSIGDIAEDACVLIDDANGWAPGEALNRFKNEDKDVQSRACEIVARRSVQRVAAHGFTPEGLAKVHATAARLGIDPERIGLPPAPQPRDPLLQQIVDRASKCSGYRLDAAHVEELEPGVFTVHVDSDGYSMSRESFEETRRAAELDGGPNNIPEVTFPLDDADGVDMRPCLLSQIQATVGRSSL